MEKKEENDKQSTSKNSKLTLENQVITVPRHIDQEKQALDLLSNEIPLSQTLLTNFHEALVAAKIAIKEEDGSYLINLKDVIASKNGSRLNKMTDYHFLNRATDLVPELVPIVKTFFEKVRNQESVNAVDQQIFLNALFDPKKQIFFDKNGAQASFEEYLRSIYGEMVEIIKVEIDYLKPELHKAITDRLNRGGNQDTAIIPQLFEYLEKVPITSILLQVGDRQFLVPILSVTMAESINAFSLPIDNQLNIICINNNLQAGSLLETFCSIAHETDHAIHNLLNKPQWPEFISTKEERTQIYNLLNDNYSREKSLDLISKYLESDTAVARRDFDEFSKIKTIATEMGGEAGNLRLLDTLQKGLLKFDADPKNQELGNLVRATYLDHIISRLSSINDLEHQPYALANHFYLQIKEKYGENEFLRIIHQLPLDEFLKIFNKSTQLSQKILTKEKANFDKYNVQIFRDYFLGKDFSQINLEQSLDKIVNESLTAEDTQKLLEEKFTNLFNNDPDQKKIFEQIKQYFDPETSDLLLTNINTILEMINLLAQENTAFANYLHLHPEELSSNDQAYQQLKLQVDTIFTVFQIKISKEIYYSEPLKHLVYDLAYAKLINNYQEELAIQPFIDKLQNLIQKLTGNKKAKFDIYTGMNLDLPILQKNDGKKQIDQNDFAQFKAKIELLLKYQPMIKALAGKIDFRDNPSLEIMQERLKEAVKQ